MRVHALNEDIDGVVNVIRKRGFSCNSPLVLAPLADPVRCAHAVRMSATGERLFR